MIGAFICFICGTVLSFSSQQYSSIASAIFFGSGWICYSLHDIKEAIKMSIRKVG